MTGQDQDVDMSFDSQDGDAHGSTQDGDAHGSTQGSGINNISNAARTDGFKATNKGASLPALNDFNDLKRKTQSLAANPERDEAHLRAPPPPSNMLSNYPSAPRFSMGVRTGSGFIKSSSAPAPGSYKIPSDEGNKFKKVPRYSFGAGSRFGMGGSPAKMQPGPGAYNPRDPTDQSSKIGFGTGMRGRGSLVSQANPGPGAYEYRSFVGQGLMFSTRGRMPTTYSRSTSQPGPGAYNPNTDPVFGASMKTGFGTSTRDDVGAKARSAAAPGPGTYDMQNVKGTGSDGPKFSATSRRKIHDLQSYLQPGPGAYNSHITSFVNADKAEDM